MGIKIFFTHSYGALIARISVVFKWKKSSTTFPGHVIVVEKLTLSQKRIVHLIVNIRRKIISFIFRCLFHVFLIHM